MIMIVIKNSISIKTKIGVVFHFLATPENLPKWNYYIQEVHKISSGNNDLGSRFHQIRKGDQQTFEITEYKRNKLIEFTTISNSSIKFKRRLKFSEFNSHCLLEDEFELDTGHPWLLQKLLHYKIRKGIKDNLLKLKQLLETGQTVLQDGRLSSIESRVSHD